MSVIDIALFREAMGRTASGVTVVTTDGEAGRAGVTVSSLCSLSMEPPSVLFCLNKGSRTLPTLIANGVFAANILAHGQHRVADSFAGLIPELADDRFAVAEWERLHTGAPVLMGALCRFDCRIAGMFEFGTHHIIAGEVLALASDAAKPLVYSNRAYHKLEVA
ncbi:flavin reductase family protein [Ancylobacter amanitiformis]|uniref:Flavin reductase (DIM6/NTAB) family NADH-FMN oxidoreductase RutF n=1 Tax=Ancylobacter amanitiformis TaxID=217069 RepID=A0ABU0LSI8_9HYPH|nr:flavin reductase family protein [Ancylobacter amanitiformis]MDQ0511653.1 flavin reductase (DIM6/NTAB) family NADH-FMN oxidoreductase RutF [Ancylobacter amanitiformis]